MTIRGRSLSTVAKHNDLFLKRKEAFKVERLSVKELAQLLVVVKDLLQSLKRSSSVKGRYSTKTFADGNEVPDVTLDETYAANLEHLLLCLQDQLLRLLISKCVELVHRRLLECQKDQAIHSEYWFAEFPDSRHPLSTTWPWSIRPSLAVIWGVCWMFIDHDSQPRFDEHGNMVDVQGNVVVPSRIVEQYLLAGRVQQEQQRQRQASYSPGGHHTHQPHPTQQVSSQLYAANMVADQNQNFSFGGGPPPYPMQQGVPRQPDFAAGAAPQPHNTTRPQFRQAYPSTSASPSPSGDSRFRLSSHSHGGQAGAHDQAAHASIGIVGRHTNYTYSAPPSNYADALAGGAHVSAAGNWLPQENFALAHGAQHFPEIPYADASNQWQLPAQSIPAQHGVGLGYGPQAQGLPQQRPRHSVAPTIRLDTAFSGPSPFQTPEDPYPSSAASSNSSVPLREHHPNQPTYTTYNSNNLSPHSPFMTTENPNVAPVSPVSARDSPSHAVMAEPMTRKRSHSQMSQEAPKPQSAGVHSRQGSTASAGFTSNSPHAEYYDSPTRGSRSYKRDRQPPANEHGKYYCDASEECQGQIFDRKCEWRLVCTRAVTA